MGRKKYLIIVEGMDNTGKDTLINGLKEYYNKLNIKETHFYGPSTKDNNNIAYIEQIHQFINNLYNITKKDFDMMIWNRSHIGEYVYGQIYRNINDKDIEKLVNLIDECLNKLDLNVVYVQLICNSNTLMIDNEDGKSLSNNVSNYKQYLKTLKRERNLFKDAFDIVSNKFSKVLINVNKGESFIDKNEILNKVIEKIDEYENK